MDHTCSSRLFPARKHTRNFYESETGEIRKSGCLYESQRGQLRGKAREEECWKIIIRAKQSTGSGRELDRKSVDIFVMIG